MIKAIVFDFDGTLVDSNTIKKNGFFLLAKKFEIPEHIVEESLIENKGRDRYDIISFIANKSQQKNAYQEMIHFYGALVEKTIAEGDEISGALDFLNQNYKDKILCLNSRTPDSNLNSIIQKMKWNHFFRKTLGSSHSKVENLRTIKKSFDLQKNEMIFIGDALEDYLAAKDFGCDFYLLQNNDNKELHTECLGFTQYAEFTKILEDRYV